MQLPLAADMKDMRVDQRNLTGVAGGETGRAQEAQSIGHEGRPGASAARGGPGADHVELSALSRALSSGAATRSQRIAQLAAQYHAGQYQVDPAQLGQTMVSDALEAPKL